MTLLTLGDKGVLISQTQLAWGGLLGIPAFLPQARVCHTSKGVPGACSEAFGGVQTAGAGDLGEAPTAQADQAVMQALGEAAPTWFPR